MSLEEKAILEQFDKARFLLVREGEREYALQITPGRGVTIEGEEDSVTIHVPLAHADDSNYFELDCEDVDDIAPQGKGLSFVEKISLRFSEAARRGTNVDLRFCSGEETLRKATQDNLRPDYGANRLG